MATVITHMKDPLQEARWMPDTREFARVPVVGEYLSLSFSGDWYRVILVAHAPFKGDYDAEIYAIKGPGPKEALEAAGGGPLSPEAMPKDAAKELPK